VKDRAPSPPRPRRRWRVVLLGLLVGLLALGLSWTTWLPPLATAVLPGLARRYADLDLELEVVAVDLEHVELRGLRAHQRGPDAVLVELRTPALRAEFDLRRLAAGDLTGLEGLVADRLVLELRLDRLPESSSPSPPQAPSALQLPATLPPLDVDLWDVSVTLPGGVLLASEEGSLSVDGESTLRASELWVAGVDESQPWRTQALTVAGRWDRAVLQEVELTSGGRALLHPSTVDLTRVETGAVGLDLKLALGQAGSGLRAQLDGAGASADFELTDVDIAELVYHAPVQLPTRARGRLGARGSLSVAWDDLAAVQAQAEFRLDAAAWGDREVAHGEGSVRLADGWLEVTRLQAEQPRNSLSLTGLRWPLFAEDPDAWLRETSADLSIEVRDLAAITGPLPLPERYKELPRHELTLSAAIAEGRIEITRGHLETTGGELTVREAVLTAGATWDAPWSLRLRSDSQLDHLDQLGLLVGQPDWWGRLDGQLELEGTWPRVEGSWELSGRNLRFGELELGALSVSLDADGERVEVRQLRASGNDIQLEASGSYVFDSRQVHGGSLELDLPRLAPWAPGVISAGAAKVSATLAGPLDELRGAARITADGLALRELEVQGFRSSIEGTGRVWRVTELHGESDLGVLDSVFELVLDESYRLIRADIQELALVRDGEGLRLERPVSLELSHEDRLTGHLSDVLLRGEAGRLEVGGELTASGLELDARAEELRPDVFLAGLDAGLPSLARVEGEAEVRGDWGYLKFDSRGSVTGLRLPGAESSADLSWNLRRKGDTLEVDELTLSGAGSLRARLQGALPTTLLFEDAREPLSLDIEANLPPAELAALLGPDSLSASGALQLSGRVTGTLEELTGDLEIAGSRLRWTEDLHPPSLGDASLSCTVQLRDGVRVEGLVLRLGELVDLTGEAFVEVPTNVRELVRDPQAFLDRAHLDARASVARVDLAAVSSTLGPHLPQLDRLRAGTLSGELRAKGPLRAPVPSGQLQLTEATIRLGSGLPTADRLQVALALEDQSFRIENVTGELGGAPFTLSGDATLAGMESELNFQLRGDDLLLFRSREAKVRANADLSLRGPLSSLTVAGKLDLSDGRYSPASEFLDLRGSPRARGARGFQLFHLREAPLSNLQFDIELTSVSPFVIRNTVVYGSVRPTLHLGGTGMLPVLTGEVYLDRTLMKLPASSLELTGGTILFLPDDPFLPVVEINGRSRILGYDITATISGKYDSPEITLSSTPPLSQESLLLLVLTGRLPDDPDQTDPLATANTVALYLAKDTLARWFTDEGPMDEDSVFNRFEFDAGRDVSKNGVETLDIAYRLTSKEDLPPERREKRHLYLAGQRDRFEDYNYGLRLVFRLKR
jgi:hypothetical protein